jgi:hypothetical protein
MKSTKILLKIDLKNLVKSDMQLQFKSFARVILYYIFARLI